MGSCCCWVTSVVSDSARPHRRQPTRLPHPWDSSAKNTGVGCHFLHQCVKVKVKLLSHARLSDPMDCSLPGSSIHGIFQAGVLEWVALSIITLNVNGLNAPTKWQKLAEWTQKQDPYICCLQETHLKTGDTYRLKVKGWKKIFQANRDEKKAGLAILISNKIDFKTKAVKRDKEGHYIMIKGSIQEEDINRKETSPTNIIQIKTTSRIISKNKFLSW